MAKGKAHKLTRSEYKRLFDTLFTSLCLFANKYVGRLDVAKDIVQEVFIKVWEVEVSFQSENAVKSFLYTAVKNKSLDFLRSRHNDFSNRLPIERLELLESENFFLREVVISETNLAIENAVNTLPKKCAQIIKLSLKEYSNVQIAKELSISINTVKAQKRIAYKKLRPMLRNSFIFLAYFMNS